ncbi:biotin transporter BioY [Pelagirhabdus alkalitolerans]|uniref:biotin transporter BioY n=1 Tax=Pelagirhabdus alkalitolerans TaxID=1612202 RepID=UPI003182F1FE
MIRLKSWRALDLSYGAIFICLMAIGANITFWFPFLAIPIGGVSVPLSLQTFFSILAGMFLGKRLAAFSLLGYLFVGIIGVPVFAQMQSGVFVLFNYTGGFLLSFVLVGYVTGLLSEKINQKNMISTSSIAFIGVFVNYIIGVSYMYLAMNTWLGLTIAYQAAWIGMVPFLIKDLVLAGIAAVVLLKMIDRMPSTAYH